MYEFKYAYNTIGYYKEDIAKSIERVVRYGYTGVEVSGHGDIVNEGPRVRRLVEEAKLEVPIVCGVFFADTDFAHPDKAIRQNAIDYVNRDIRFAAEIGGKYVVVCPSVYGKQKPLADLEEERKWIIDGIRQCALYAQQNGVGLAFEPWNRYETYVVNTLKQAAEWIKEIDMPNIGILADIFHMNIEEADIVEAIRTAGDKIVHTHFADSNRSACGNGHLDFLPILQALKDIDYKGFISFEPFPPTPDSFAYMEKYGGREFYDEYTEQNIRVIKEIARQIK